MGENDVSKNLIFNIDCPILILKKYIKHIFLINREKLNKIIKRNKIFKFKNNFKYTEINKKNINLVWKSMKE